MSVRRAVALAAAAAAALLATALATRSCGVGVHAPYAFAPDAAVSLELTIGEELLPQGVERRIHVALEGRAQADALPLRVRHARMLRRPSADVEWVELDPAATAPYSETQSDRDHLRVLGGLAGATVTFRFDATTGLRAVEGIDAALAATAADGNDDVQAGLASILGDGPALRGLRAAGLAEVPARFSSGSTARRVAVFVPGRGTCDVSLECASGRDADGSPVVRGDGGIPPGAAFAGDPGPEPPAPVATERVEVRAQTNFLADRVLPYRGMSVVLLPSRASWSIRRTVSFVLILP